jgi:type I restriction enzyme, R subunit
MDFLVINQFKVELTSGRGHVIPDAVLFVNGIPLVVVEFKSPSIRNPLQEAINQLLRYSNQRRELVPTLYTEILGFINKVAANLYRDPALNLLGVAEKVKALINAHVSARGVDPKIPPTTITDTEFEHVLAGQTSSRARAAQMQHAARYHIVGFANQNPAYARQMSEKLEEILQRFKDDWDALERELRQFIEELRQGDRNEFPDLDPKVQVPFVRLVLEECSKGRELNEARRTAALSVTLDMVERIRQEVRKVGFWKNSAMRELLTRSLVRDLDRAEVCPAGQARALAQRLVALARENHEYLTRP